jgi:hypothetical protein
MFLFFFTPRPIRHPKRVDEKKNQNRLGVLMRANYIISLVMYGVKLKDVA